MKKIAAMAFLKGYTEKIGNDKEFIPSSKLPSSLTENSIAEGRDDVRDRLHAEYGHAVPRIDSDVLDRLGRGMLTNAASNDFPTPAQANAAAKLQQKIQREGPEKYETYHAGYDSLPKHYTGHGIRREDLNPYVPSYNKSTHPYLARLFREKFKNTSKIETVPANVLNDNGSLQRGISIGHEPSGMIPTDSTREAVKAKGIVPEILRDIMEGTRQPARQVPVTPKAQATTNQSKRVEVKE